MERLVAPCMFVKGSHVCTLIGSGVDALPARGSRQGLKPGSSLPSATREGARWLPCPVGCP
jgi:hypothetical protein